MSDVLGIALKEWAVTCEALARGQLSFLLRKGGIHERKGRFAIEHQEFWLFGGTEHQKPELLKSPFRDECAPPAEDSIIRLAYLCRLVDVRPAPPDLAAATRLIDQGIWTPDFFRIRYEYKPELPLHVMIVRAYSTDRPHDIPNLKRYAGCRSWVPLVEPLPFGNLTPAIPDDAFAAARARITAACEAGLATST